MQDDPTDPAAESAAGSAPGGHGDGSDAVAAGLEQFQRAALEAIRAGRAMLDAAESMLQDPHAAETVVRTVGAVARTATETVAGFAAGRVRSADAEPAGGRPNGGGRADGDGPGGDDDPPDGGFERISVG